MRAEPSFTILPEDDRPRYGAEAVYALNALVAALAWLYFVSAGFSANGILDGVYEIQATMLGQGRLTIVPGPMSMFYHDALMYWGQDLFLLGLVSVGPFSRA